MKKKRKTTPSLEFVIGCTNEIAHVRLPHLSEQKTRGEQLQVFCENIVSVVNFIFKRLRMNKLGQCD